MKIMTKKSRSFDQEKLKIVCDELCDNIDGLLDSFDLEYRINNRLITMCCPIHNGDNTSAINIYPEGERYRGNWVCRTHNCEKIFKGSIIGFIRGILSSRKYNWSKEGDDTCSFQEALNYATSFLKKDFSKIKISKTDKEKKTFTNVVSYLNKEPIVSESKITREHIIKSIKIPAEYYISRDYSSDILKKYDVGLCENPDKPMRDRVVVPIYDTSYSDGQYKKTATHQELLKYFPNFTFTDLNTGLSEVINYFDTNYDNIRK